MTGHEALAILQNPRFGDPDHIYARDILRVIDGLEEETGKSRKALMLQQIDVNSYADLLEEGSL